jgi:hypothetical protein
MSIIIIPFIQSNRVWFMGASTSTGLPKQCYGMLRPRRWIKHRAQKHIFQSSTEYVFIPCHILNDLLAIEKLLCYGLWSLVLIHVLPMFSLHKSIKYMHNREFMLCCPSTHFINQTTQILMKSCIRGLHLILVGTDLLELLPYSKMKIDFSELAHNTDTSLIKVVLTEICGCYTKHSFIWGLVKWNTFGDCSGWSIGCCK